MKLVSACLVGARTRWNGENRFSGELFELFLSGELLPVCPELLSGLPVPRPPLVIVGGAGREVWEGRARVIMGEEDVTERLMLGARRVLEIAKAAGINSAIFKSLSPSCGLGRIKILERIVEGDGITAFLLLESGIEVRTEEDLGFRSEHRDLLL